MLSEIRKSNHTEAADKKEVDQLRSEVHDLRSRINSMAKDMQKLSALLQAAAPSIAAEVFATSTIASKKRKITPLPSPVGSFETTSVSPEPMPVTSLIDAERLNDSGLKPSNVSIENEVEPLSSESNSTRNVVVPHVPKIPPVPSPNHLTSASMRDESLASLSPVDEEILTSLFSLEPSSSNIPSDDDTIHIGAHPRELSVYEDDMINFEIPDMAMSIEPSNESITSRKEIEGKLIGRMKESIAKLPKSLQKHFIDRLVALTSQHAASQSQIDAISALIEAAANEANTHLGSPISTDEEYEKNVELATTALKSFLSRYTCQDVALDLDALDSLGDPLPDLPLEP